MLIKCAFVGQKTLIFIEMHGTTTTKILDIGVLGYIGIV
jgi:hypothetical protein